MKDQYGSKEGEQVFYASRNKGILPKVEKASMGKSFGPPPIVTGKHKKPVLPP